MKVENLLCTSAEGRVLAEKISFDVRPGDVLLINGPNGSGKTTLIRTLIGRHNHFQGQITRNLSLQDTAYLPQLQQVSFHLPLTLRNLIQSSCSCSLSDSQISSFGLLNPTQLDLHWNTASGGERKRALLTSTLLSNPQLLVLDEPFNHLDRNSIEVICARLNERLHDQSRMFSLVLVTHPIHRIQSFDTLKAHAHMLELGA